MTLVLQFTIFYDRSRILLLPFEKIKCKTKITCNTDFPTVC